MQIQVDTREHKKEWERIEKQFIKAGVDYFRSKLYCGDYMSMDNPRLVIDRKKDLLELCGNVCQQHERFRSELIRARDTGIKIIVLVEHGKDITCLQDVYFWENPRLYRYEWVIQDGHPVKKQIYPNATTGTALYKSLETIQNKYGVRFEFCEPHETGYKIIELLKDESQDGADQ